MVGILSDAAKRSLDEGMEDYISPNDASSQLSIVQGSYGNPDEHAENLELSKESGLPVEIVQHDKEEVKRQVGLSKLNQEALDRGLEDWLKVGDNAKLSYDDISHLNKVAESNHRRPWYDFKFDDLDGLADSMAVGTNKFYHQAMVGILSTSFDDLGAEISKTKTMEEADAVRKEFEAKAIERQDKIKRHMATLGVAEDIIADITPDDLTTMGKGIRGGFQMAADMAPGLAVSALTGGAFNPTLAYLTAKTGLESYGSARLEGKSHKSALLYGGVDAGLELITEKIPTKYANKLFDGSSAGNLKETIGKFMVGDLAGEQVATVTQTLNAYAHDLDEELANAKDAWEMIDIQAERQVVTAISTIVGSGGVSGAAYAVDRVGNRELYKNRAILKNIENRVQSEAAQDWLDDQIYLAQSSKLNERTSEAFADYLESIDPDSFVFMKAETAAELENIPDYISSQLDDTGADVSIPLAKFLTDFAKDESLLAQVRPYVKVQTEFLTQDEIENNVDVTQAKTLIENAEKHQQSKTEADIIFEQVKDQLVGTRRQGEHTARLSAQLIPAYIVTKQADLAARGIDVSVKQLYEDMNLKVIGPKEKVAPAKQVLDQDEQNEYDAAVAKGLDMSEGARKQRAADMGFDTDQVIYHGTNNKFDYFDNTVARDGAHFFTTNKEHALNFGEVNDYYLKISNPMVIDQDNLEDAWDKYHPEAFDEVGSFKDDFETDILPRDFVDDFVNDAKNKGHDGLIIKQMSDVGLEADVYLPFDPSQIRSVNAAFDPEHATSPKILAQQKLGDMTFEDTGVDDAGNVVKVSEKAQSVWNHHQKRLKMVENLRVCVSG